MLLLFFLGGVGSSHFYLLPYAWSVLLSHPGPCDSGRVREAPGYAPGCHDPYLGDPMGQHGSGGTFIPKRSLSVKVKVGSHPI